jgi:hypothetical protein
MSISNSIGSAGFPVPVGTIIAFAGQVIPPKYLLCDGGAFSGATYPILASLLGGVTTTPNLVGGIIGGGTTRNPVNGRSYGPATALFDIDVANVPAFTTTVQSFSASGALNGTGQTNSNSQDATPSGSGNNAVFHGGQPMLTDVGVTGTFVGQLNAHAGDPVEASVVDITEFNPATVAIQYIIKAGY